LGKSIYSEIHERIQICFQNPYRNTRSLSKHLFHHVSRVQDKDRKYPFPIPLMLEYYNYNVKTKYMYIYVKLTIGSFLHTTFEDGDQPVRQRLMCSMLYDSTYIYIIIVYLLRNVSMIK